MWTKNNREFVMVCKDFGPKFLFNARSYRDATAKARKYSLYHSMSGQFKATPTENCIDAPGWLAIHNEWV